MSLFDTYYGRLQNLNEARKSPVESLVPGAVGVTKQMRSAGLSSAPLDTIKFIRELLFNLDVISEDDLNTVKAGKGFTGKKQAMLNVLQSNQDAINAKSDEIAQTIENTLDDFISGMGANRSREEKYAAQAAAQELAAQARAARSGKDMDDALADVISDEKLLIKASLAKTIQELDNLPAGEDISPAVLDEIKKFAPNINTIEQFESFVKQLSELEEYQIPAAYLSSTVKAIKGGLEDIEMEDQEDPDDFQAKIDATLEIDDEARDMLDMAEKILGNLEDNGHYDLADNGVKGAPGADDEAVNMLYNLQDAGWTTGSAAYTLSRDIVSYGRKAIPQTEDSEGSVKQEVLDACKAHAGEFAHKATGMAKACEDLYNKYGKDGDQERAEIASSLQKYYETQSKFEARVEDQEDLDHMEDVEGKYDDNDGKEERCDHVPCEDGEVSIKQQVLDTCKQHAARVAGPQAVTTNAGMALGCKSALEEYNQDGDQEKAEIASNLHRHFDEQAKGGFEKTPYKAEDYEEVSGEENESKEMVAESRYSTADYLIDIYSEVKPIIESTIDENGIITPTEQYLVEHAEQAIEEVYTSQYLTEQKAEDSLPKQKKEKSLSFKERFQPKTSWQLEEVRRYGL
ncbi:hypothetical protein N9273_00625 [bacterium]|nr:hypothetical protein [bacterium]